VERPASPGSLHCSGQSSLPCHAERAPEQAVDGGKGSCATGMACGPGTHVHVHVHVDNNLIGI